MTPKDDYYQRIISSLQSDITSLKTIVSEQGKEIEYLKTNVSPVKTDSNKEPTKEDMKAFLGIVSKVCYEIIKENITQLPEFFTTKGEFIQYKNSADKKFLSSETFNDYNKNLDIRLKAMEEKLGRRFSFLTINQRIQKCDYNGKGCSKLQTFLGTFKMDRYTKWLLITLTVLFFSFIAIALTNEHNHIKKENQILKQSIQLIQQQSK